MSELSNSSSHKLSGSLNRIAALRANLERATGAPVTANTAGHGVVWLLLDVSTSMEDKLAEAVAGAREFARASRRKGYRVGLIGFGSHAHVCAKPVADESELDRALIRLIAGGSTDMAGALALVEQELRQSAGRRAVALVTDGSPNDRDATLNARERLVGLSVEVLTLGVSGADENFLARLATSRELAVQTPVAALRAGVANLAGLLR
jgi:Mg-chelatase subunit ChlD